MSGRFTKRGKNQGAVDSWLDSLGYYRKNIAYDETCLFRAVSEQLFYTQINHEEIRNKAIQYAIDHHSEFKHLVSSRRDWLDHLQKLSVHMVICSVIEIKIVSQAYKVDVIVFDAAKRQKQEYKFDKNKVSTKIVQICKLGEDHFDTVYHKEHIVNTGFCQSIVYSILYEDVYGLQNVSSTVNSMLHDKDGSLCMYYAEKPNNNNNSNSDEELVTSSTSIILAPFPFKVAKALDPNMYRNIEYDSWLETRREFRLGEWYYGDDNLILGTRCLLAIGLEEYQCYIQEFQSNRRCVVFVTKLAQRMTVSYDDLKREDNAKPWPLPYRFARSSLTPSSPMAETVDSNSKGFRKRRDRKRPENNNSNSAHFEDSEANNFEGLPLVKQEANDVWLLPRPKLSLQISNSTAAANNEDWSFVPEEPPFNTGSTESDFYINSPNTVATPPEATASANYEGVQNDSQVIYTYNQEYSYPSLPVWSNPPYAISPDMGIHLRDGNVSPIIDNGNKFQQKYVYCAPDSAYSSPAIMTPGPSLNYGYSDRSVCSTPITPTAPPPRFDVYPFIYSPMPIPTTPVFYPPPPQAPPPPPPTFTPMFSPLQTIPTQCSQEYIFPSTLNSPMPLYNSPYELQYYSTPSYSSWSHPYLNPQQGFIFPTPLTSNYV